MATVIKPDQFEDSLRKVIQMYGNNAASVTFQILEDTANESKDKLKTTNWGWKKHTNQYQNSFRVEFRKVTGSWRGASVRIYAAAPHYRRTHLLENGHKNPKAGTGKKPNPKAKSETRAFKHWKTVEEYAVKELEERLLMGLLDVRVY